MFRFVPLLLLLVSSCTLFDTRSYQPAYILVDNVTVSTSEEQGYPSKNIKEIWMYANDSLLGVFPLPARIPVIVSGDRPVKLTAFAGIRNDGISSLPFIYQFLQRSEQTVNIEEGQEYNMDIQFRYSDNAKFAFVEDFEGDHIFTFEGDEDPKTVMISTTEGAKYGTRTGLIRLDTSHHTASVGLENAISGKTLKRSDAYLELDYKNNIPFAISVAIIDKGKLNIKNKLLIKESAKWNKIYVDLTDILNSVSLKSYRILISSTIKGSKVSKGEVYIDNIKMVHF